MVHCYFPGCKANSRHKDNGVTFHRFPKIEQIRKIWFQKINKEYNSSYNIRLCSWHFDDSSFVAEGKIGDTRRRLRDGAIPTLGLPSKTWKEGDIQVQGCQQYIASKLYIDASTQTDPSQCRCFCSKTMIDTGTQHPDDSTVKLDHCYSRTTPISDCPVGKNRCSRKTATAQLDGIFIDATNDEDELLIVDYPVYDLSFMDTIEEKYSGGSEYHHHHQGECSGGSEYHHHHQGECSGGSEYHHHHQEEENQGQHSLRNQNLDAEPNTCACQCMIKYS
ncbi:uncharacterized protein LOC144440599 [Glandiceps talaboti]